MQFIIFLRVDYSLDQMLAMILIHYVLSWGNHENNEHKNLKEQLSIELDL
jgi:hypothetical protein